MLTNYVMVVRSSDSSDLGVRGDRPVHRQGRVLLRLRGGGRSPAGSSEETAARRDGLQVRVAITLHGLPPQHALTVSLSDSP